MRVVHINKNDVAGGAAGSLYRLHRGLRGIGVDSRMFVLRKDSADPTIDAYRPALDPVSRVRRGVFRRLYLHATRSATPRMDTTTYGPFNGDRTQFSARSVLRQLPSADLVTLNWVAQFIDLVDFIERLPQTIPLVWRLSDLNPITGGCHYDFGCERYLEGCHRCPQLGSRSDRDFTRRTWRRKHRLFQGLDGTRLQFVAQSHWMAGQVGRSALVKHLPVTVIPNGLETRTFAPRDAADARAALDIPPDARVLLFVADSTRDRRKGFGLLAAAIQDIDIPNLYLLSVGRHEPEMEVAHRHRHLGVIAEERDLATVYSAADLFVIPSLQDNFPNTVLEAMACGTPVVGFETGGVPDMVREGVTGHLCPVGDVRALRDALSSLLRDDAARKAMAVECRNVVLAEFSLEKQARRYLDVYTAIVDRRHRAGPPSGGGPRNTGTNGSLEVPRLSGEA